MLTTQLWLDLFAYTVPLFLGVTLTNLLYRIVHSAFTGGY